VLRAMKMHLHNAAIVANNVCEEIVADGRRVRWGQ